jgi:alkylhydroperoxidase/carboxymuconolactone decarboxylase family protein YurZ
MMKASYKTLILLFVTFGCFYSALMAQNTRTNQALTNEQQGIIPIAALTARGELDQLKVALNDGLDAGLTINEIKEVLVHVSAYAGFPRSIRGLQTCMDVLDEREAEGIDDEWGREAAPIDDERSKYERGAEILTELTGLPPEAFQGGYAEFAPEIEVFLKEHLFADLFERDVLSYAERQLVTISVLSSLDGLEPMLGSHFNICLNVGIEPDQLRHFVRIIESTLGDQKAKTVQTVLDEVLKNRNSE